jgi:dihydrofolate synthase / folylpolyglutamate synthase
MIKKSLTEWLDWIKTLHTQEIDLGLERVFEVARRLDVLNPNVSIVTVGGTNGKGSCVAALSAIYLAAGYRIGAFTSPFLFHFNEQVQIQGMAAKDDDFCAAFDQVFAACGEITLTPFEWTTLAAFIMFKTAKLDIWILEVGLGGRYDAVNILDADVALIASISLDHTDWLGHTREMIAYQKAGIFRANKPAVCGDIDPPQSLLDEPVEKLYCQMKQFGFECAGNGWNWWSEKDRLEQLPRPKLALQNISTVLMAIELLQKKRPVPRTAIFEGLKNVHLSGRIQVIPGDVAVIYDVSHNPASAQLLAEYLQQHPCVGQTTAVFSMLADKDVVSTLNVIKALVGSWEIAPLHVARGASGDFLMRCFFDAGIVMARLHESIEKAFAKAKQAAQKGDRIVVFGSFHTVAKAAVTLIDTK